MPSWDVVVFLGLMVNTPRELRSPRPKKRRYPSLSSYSYDTSLINSAGPAPVPEPSTYGLIGIGALGAAFAAHHRKVKAV